MHNNIISRMMHWSDPDSLAIVVAAEAAIAHLWLPTLGWPLHAIGFALGALAGWTMLGADAVLTRAADSQAVRNLLETPDHACKTE